MSDKTDNPILVDVYGHKDVPTAAKFGVGARDRAEIEKATDARRDQSDANTASGDMTEHNHNTLGETLAGLD